MKTEAQLKQMKESSIDAYAAESLGIVFEEDVEKDQKIAEVLAAQGDAQADVEEEEEAVATPQERDHDIQTPPSNEEKFRVIVNQSEGPGGDLPVPVGVNGFVVTVPRGVEVKLRKRFVNAMKLATKTVYDEKRDAQGNIARVAREVPRFSFQILGPAE